MTLAASDLAAGGGDLRDGAAVVLVAHLLFGLAVIGAVAHAHVGRVRRRRARQPAAAAESLAATAGTDEIDKMTIGYRVQNPKLVNCLVTTFGPKRGL